MNPLLPDDAEIELLGQRAVCVSSEIRGNQWWYGFQIPTHAYMGVFWYPERKAFMYLTDQYFRQFYAKHS